MSRGYFGIGIENPKTEMNVGTLWRSAYALGAAFIFTIGKRYDRQSSDTTKSWRHIPLITYIDAQDFIDHIPYSCIPVGIEVNGTPINEFNKHPERAAYILGPEDGSISKRLAEFCVEVISIDSKYCLNVAVAGSIVMFDRNNK